MPVENAIFGVAKLGLLLAFASVFVDAGIFASWTIPVLLAIVPVNLLIFRRLIPRHRKAHGDGEGFRLREISRFVAVDYVSSLLAQSYTGALPLRESAGIDRPLRRTTSTAAVRSSFMRASVPPAPRAARKTAQAPSSASRTNVPSKLLELSAPVTARLAAAYRRGTRARAALASAA